MIKIIKEGKKSFVAKCAKCGCEFVYELEDIIIDSVCCPFCGKSIMHKKQAEDEHQAWDKYKYGSYYGADYPINKTVTATDTSEE